MTTRAQSIVKCEFWLSCDDCGCVMPVSSTGKQAKVFAFHLGWAINQMMGTDNCLRDYCPTCWAIRDDE